MEESRFQFKGFRIKRSLIERNESLASTKISIGMSPKGTLKINDSIFELELKVIIHDENKAFKIEVDAVAFYEFDAKVEKDKLNSMFYINAPAILFPYIRAYISTLTNLSGFETITLPTLNVVQLGKDLEKNTSEI